jgi:hypothetical protein
MDQQCSLNNLPRTLLSAFTRLLTFDGNYLKKPRLEDSQLGELFGISDNLACPKLSYLLVQALYPKKEFNDRV